MSEADEAVTYPISRHIGNYTLIDELQKLIRDRQIKHPDFPEVASIFVSQAFWYDCQVPQDPWASDTHLGGLRARIVRAALKLGILIIEEEKL